MSSRSSSPSREDSPPLQLDPATLAALAGFLSEKEEAEEQFRQLEEKAHKRLMDAQAKDDEDEDKEPEKMMSPAEFRKMFGEDWQLSQFWYSDDFASRFSSFVYSFCTPTTRVAFLSCPTSYVAFQHQNPLKDAWLFEYDARFELFAADKFVHYDLEEPLKFPEALRGSVDIAIADPPFLNEVTNRYFAKTLRALLKPTGKLLLLTSTSVEARPRVYDSAPIGPLLETTMEVEHAGNRLQNDFRCWASWEWEGEQAGVAVKKQ